MQGNILDRRRKFLLGVGVCASLISLYMYVDVARQSTSPLPSVDATMSLEQVQDDSRATEPQQNSTPASIRKRILFWTTFFGAADFYVRFGTSGFKNCPVKDCETTNRRQLLSESDAVIFHGRDMNRLDLPNTRRIDQRWVFLLYESPINTPDSIAYFNNMFNWTMTYRTDSDIYRSYSEAMTNWRRNEKMSAIRERLQKKNKLVAWFVSHCSTHSKRENYVEELQKYIEVDIYGGCGPKKCADRLKCYEMLANEYKFYLSFENSLCRDYVTEKFYSALAHSVVPVVYGGVDYCQFAPNGSFIDVRDFKSPRELADYLLYLNNNQTAYEQYFEWRETYDYDRRPSSWCKLCEMLHNSTLPSKTYSSIHNWWTVEGNCGKEPVKTSRPDVSFVWKNRTNEM